MTCQNWTIKKHPSRMMEYWKRDLLFSYCPRLSPFIDLQLSSPIRSFSPANKKRLKRITQQLCSNWSLYPSLSLEVWTCQKQPMNFVNTWAFSPVQHNSIPNPSLNWNYFKTSVSNLLPPYPSQQLATISNGVWESKSLSVSSKLFNKLSPWLIIGLIPLILIIANSLNFSQIIFSWLGLLIKASSLLRKVWPFVSRMALELAERLETNTLT